MRRVAAIISAAVLIGSGLLLISGGAALASCNSTNHFCAWKDVDYNGSKLLDSGLGAGSRNVFPEEKDAVSSGKNFTGNKWCGVNEHTFEPDDTIVVWSPSDQLSNLINQGANDQIDHFDVVATGHACPA